MARKRRRFTAEFKKRVALEALRERDTVQAIASRYKVHPNQVSAWKRQAVESLGEVFSGPGCQYRSNTPQKRRLKIPQFSLPPPPRGGQRGNWCLMSPGLSNEPGPAR